MNAHGKRMITVSSGYCYCGCKCIKRSVIVIRLTAAAIRNYCVCVGVDQATEERWAFHRYCSHLSIPLLTQGKVQKRKKLTNVSFAFTHTHPLVKTNNVPFSLICHNMLLAEKINISQFPAYTCIRT